VMNDLKILYWVPGIVTWAEGGRSTDWATQASQNVFCSNETTLGGLLEEVWSPERPSHD